MGRAPRARAIEKGLADHRPERTCLRGTPSPPVGFGNGGECSMAPPCLLMFGPSPSRRPGTGGYYGLC